jgi:TolB-like protein/DNA-binding winged helix-turn-helix (wHTH) protein/tetratricopeptide (TPR) repeat protein
MNLVPADRRNGDLRIGEWLVRPSLNQLSRGEIAVHLRPKVMDVLVLLAAHPGEVVSKEEIINAVWAKKFLGDAVLSRAVFELREAVGDDAQHPTFIETVAKRGYRLLAPVGPPSPAEVEPPGPGPQRASATRWRIAVAVAALAAAVVATWLTLGRAAPRAAEAPARTATRIVVLPFVNLGSPEDDYFAAGITDEITGRLTSVPGIAVISRDSADHYASSSKTHHEIGRELGVDYVLDGTVRWDRARDRRSSVRITPRLIRVRDDTQVWANAYDRVIEDIFGVQSEIARNVIAEVGIALKEPARDELDSKPTESIDAYQAFLRGMYHSASVYRSEQSLRLGLQMLERAVQIDPGFAVAWAEIARVRAVMYLDGFDRTERSHTEARQAIDRALKLAPDSPRVRFNLGLYCYWFDNNYQRALDEFATARKARGDWADIRVAEAYVLRRAGRWHEALQDLDKAAELDPIGWGVARERGVTSLYLREYGDAERHLKKAIALAPDEQEVYGFLAETYWGWTGDLTKARAALQAMPPSGDAWPTYWWFWQDVYEGKYQDALDRTLASPVDKIGAALTWVSKDLLLARAYAFLGRTTDARRTFERERVRVEQLLRETPDDFSLHGALGLCLAGLGRKDEAIHEGRRAVELLPISKDAVYGHGSVLTLAEIYTMVGEPELACEHLDTLLAMPSTISVPTLKLDPRWLPLRGHPRFQGLLAKYTPPGKSAL